MRAARTRWYSPRPWLLTLVWTAAGALLLTASGSTLGAPQDTKPWVAPRRAARKMNPVPADEESIAAGRAVYIANCLACHGQTGTGNGPAAAALNPRPNDLADPKVWEQSDGAIFWKTTRGRAPMPSYKNLLTDEERWNVMNYMRTFVPNKELVTPPKFDVPQKCRKPLSALLKPYADIHAAIVKDDLSEARHHAQSFATALSELEQVKTDEFSSKIGARWNDSVQVVSGKLEMLIVSKDIVSMRQRFANFSNALVEAFGRFGHTEKVPVRVFASETEYGGKPALWLQAGREPVNPYGGPDRRRQGTLKKLLGAHRQKNTNGGVT